MLRQSGFTRTGRSDQEKVVIPLEKKFHHIGQLGCGDGGDCGEGKIKR